MIKRRSRLRVQPVLQKDITSEPKQVASEIENNKIDTTSSPRPESVEESVQNADVSSVDRSTCAGKLNETITFPVETPSCDNHTDLRGFSKFSIPEIVNFSSATSSPRRVDEERDNTSLGYVNIPIVFECKNDLDSDGNESLMSGIINNDDGESLQSGMTEPFRKSPDLVLCIDKSKDENVENIQRVDRTKAAEKLADRLVFRRVTQERRKSRPTSILKEPVNSSRICMKDLIYLNPQDNPMVNTLDKGVSIIKEAKATGAPEKGGIEDLPVPQLEIGPDGKIIINEASLVITQKSLQFDEMEVVDETNFEFSGYPKKPRSKRWGMRETKRFYAALSMIGTDFFLMSKLFPNRTRDDIKKKFKREDKVNRVLIDTALKERRPLDISLLAEPPSEDELMDEPPVKKKSKSQKENKTESKPKKTRKSRKRVISYESSSEDLPDDTIQSSKPETQLLKKMPKRLRIDDDSTVNGGDLPGRIDPYEFLGDTEEEVEVTQIILRKQPRPSRTIIPVAAPELSTQDISDNSSSTHSKLEQQLEQMERDKKRSTLKTDLETTDNADSSQHPKNESPKDKDVPGDGNHKESIPAIDESSTSNISILGKGRPIINVIDHHSINLEDLGIGEIPPDHKLVVISTPLGDNILHQEGEDPDQQLLQVFTLSESTLESMMDVVNSSTFDPVPMLLAMAQGNTSNINEISEDLPDILDTLDYSDCIKFESPVKILSVNSLAADETNPLENLVADETSPLENLPTLPSASQTTPTTGDNNDEIYIEEQTLLPELLANARMYSTSVTSTRNCRTKKKKS